MMNQNPEQTVRDSIDEQLKASGWVVQSKEAINLQAGAGQAVREYPTDTGPADYVLFVRRKPIGVIEAKREDLGQNLTVAEGQTEGYAHAGLKWIKQQEPLPFLYQSTGIITRFTDARDPKPRSREVFSFHRPETLQEQLQQGCSLRARLLTMPPLNPENLRACQERAINNLEISFQQDQPRALIQMATGAGKTYTAITSIYRLLKYGQAQRILFLVDTKNLGEQAEQEMLTYTPNDDNRKFTELYSVQRLQSPHVPKDAQVCISTIQRMYSILQGKELDDILEEIHPAEQLNRAKTPLPVAYNPKVSPDFFDFIFVDECHRSIYNLWRQVLDYFDAYLIGLTATPDKRTYGFFKKNLVSEYAHEQAVADGVNVGNEVFIIDTKISKEGAILQAEQQVEHREKLSRSRRWETQDEDEAYSNKQLDRDIVNPDQIRTVIKAFKDSLPTIFPSRKEVPKTLIFAKTDSHADDIIRSVREQFGEGNDFCKKITYRAGQDSKDAEGKVIIRGEDPKSVLAHFRNEYHPRIAVTVNMIATGTDVKPLECLLFMRDVKSRNYFEQMKGRGTRTLDQDALLKVSPSAQTAKTHYVIVDAIGVSKSIKTASQPLITKPTVSLKDLAMDVMLGAHDADTVSSLAGRLARLQNQLDEQDKEQIQKTTGVALPAIISDLFAAIDPDRIEAEACALAGQPQESDPGEEKRAQAQEVLVGQVAKVFTGEVITLLDNIRRMKEQRIDHDNLDEVLVAAWDQDAGDQAQEMVEEFRQYLEANRDAIEALEIFFAQPHRRRDITFEMVDAVLKKLKVDRPVLAPLRVWQAYAQVEEYQGKAPLSELTALMALLRRVSGVDAQLSTYDATVRRNFQRWVLDYHAGAGEKFNEEQMRWLQMIRDHIINSFHFERDDLETAPFDGQGGLGKMYQLFGVDMDGLIDELNEGLAA